MAINEIMKAIDAAVAQSSYTEMQRAADVFEDDLMGLGRMPTDYFDLLCHILGNVWIANSPGVSNFVINTYTDFEKLDGQQQEKLLEIFVERFHSYVDEELCLASCDFIARCYPVSVAAKVLDGLSTIACNESQITGLIVAVNAFEKRDELSRNMKIHFSHVKQTLSNMPRKGDGSI